MNYTTIVVLVFGLFSCGAAVWLALDRSRQLREFDDQLQELRRQREQMGDRLAELEKDWLDVVDPQNSLLVLFPASEVIDLNGKFIEGLPSRMRERILSLKGKFSELENSSPEAELGKKIEEFFAKIADCALNEESMATVMEQIGGIREKILNDPGSLGDDIWDRLPTLKAVSLLGACVTLVGLAICVLRTRRSWNVQEGISFLVAVERSEPYQILRTACIRVRPQLASGRLHISEYDLRRTEFQRARTGWFQLCERELANPQNEGDIDRALFHLSYACLTLYIDYSFCEDVDRVSEYRLILPDEIEEFKRASDRLRAIGTEGKRWKRESTQRAIETIAEIIKNLRKLQAFVDMAPQARRAARASDVEVSANPSAASWYSKLLPFRRPGGRGKAA